MKGYEILLSMLVARVSCDLVDYYENLIEEEIQKAASYQFPKDASRFRPVGRNTIDFGVYDFVVVGAGSAGSVVANRLSEISEWKILLLEAGKTGNDFTEIPGMVPYLIRSDYNWGFNSTPQTECCQGLKKTFESNGSENYSCVGTGGVCPYPRGKSLGGTSTINILVYARGNKADYDRWASLGNPDWSYKKVLPYFIKSENSQVYGDVGYHGFGGYLNVEYHYPQNKKVDVFLTGNKELGRPVIDTNGERQIGTGYTNFNTINGRRLSTEKAFLQPAFSRPNLRILTESYVEKIVVGRRSKTVIGVLFSRNNTRYLVRVGKEVILSAGVVGSPHILMHSGIGPKHHLQHLNIPVINNLQVGYNMHDHFIIHNIYISTKTSDPRFPLRESIKQYLKGVGQLATTTNPQAISFFHLSANNLTSPDFELIFVPYVDANSESGIFQESSKPFWKKTDDYRVSQFALVLLHPKTRGRIYLKSNDPFVYPLIDVKCFGDVDNEDLKMLYEGIRKVIELIDTEAFRKVGAELLREPLCETHKFNTRGYWLCVVRMTGLNAYHGGGTCQMGTDPSKGAVVDNKLRVYGINKLRVADVSVIPVTISGHMSAPAIMIGERVADFIKEDHLKI
ncbi:hypothetical protein FQR65_LT18443 [Abscondita terminalis]|nr:hypothetical protein FQR65_LT18443 [Abscondita terminalis]